MQRIRRIWPALPAAVVVLAFLGIGLGPERVNPWLMAVLGLEPPVPPAVEPVAGAANVVARALDLVTEADVRRQMDRFTRVGSRVPGYPGHDVAGRYILEEFRRLGLQDVKAETLYVTSPVEKHGSLKLLETGDSIAMHAIWPNLVKTSSLPTWGVRTR